MSPMRSMHWMKSNIDSCTYLSKFESSSFNGSTGKSPTCFSTRSISMLQATLFYLIGPSGSGKDALLAYAREHLAGSTPVLFSHRYITRPSQAGGENHIALTQTEFDQRQQLGLFALNWQSHQYEYGIGVEIDTWMQSGAHVVVNGSREYLSQASQRYPQMQVILLEVSEAVIRKRLVERGRETAQQIEARIAHNQELPPVEHPHLHVLNNDAPLAETGASFMALLKRKDWSTGIL